MSALTGPDRAQCAACGGVLVPAGDDWAHDGNTACTLLADPVLCWRSDCAMPADVGCLACRAHAGVFP